MKHAGTNANPKKPHEAPQDSALAFRASSLMSVQLDALDLLANPSSAMSFTPRQWVFYKVIDKIVRLYRVIADNRHVRLRFTGSSVAEALLDQRTIHIIPSVFIDNAV